MTVISQFSTNTPRDESRRRISTARCGHFLLALNVTFNQVPLLLLFLSETERSRDGANKQRGVIAKCDVCRDEAYCPQMYILLSRVMRYVAIQQLKKTR